MATLTTTVSDQDCALVKYDSAKHNIAAAAASAAAAAAAAPAAADAKLQQLLPVQPPVVSARRVTFARLRQLILLQGADGDSLQPRNASLSWAYLDLTQSPLAVPVQMYPVHQRQQQERLDHAVQPILR